MSKISLVLALRMCLALALPIIHTDSGFTMEAGASWWKPEKGVNGMKTGGDGFYLTESFRTQIFEPLVEKLINSINSLHNESNKQQRFDVVVTICVVGFVIASTTTVLISIYRNHCSNLQEK